jgi:tetratricopeptide (TPR) repeat protein
MAHEHFDLARHSIDEVPGKLLSLNGAEYVFHTLADEGGETFIFPIENVRSGLVLFLCKIYKFRPTAPEYDVRWRIDGPTQFVFNMIGAPTLHEETYEIPGGMMRLALYETGGIYDLRAEFHQGELVHVSSDYIRSPTPLLSTPREHHNLLQEASNHFVNREWESAIQVLDHILSLNPLHSFASLWLGVIYQRLGYPYKVSERLQAAIRIEPNDTRLYQVLADGMAALGRPQEAIAILDATLRRHQWDWKSWEAKREIATKFSLVDTLEKMRVEAHEIIFGPAASIGDTPSIWSDIAADFDKRIQQSQKFVNCACLARNCQAKGDWNGAIEQWRNAADNTRLDSKSRFNEIVCHFRKGERAEIADTVLEIGYGLPDDIEICALLALMVHEDLGQVQMAANFASIIDSTVGRAEELPGIPILMSGQTEDGGVPPNATFMELDVGPIVASLKRLASHRLPNELAIPLQSLIRKYAARQPGWKGALVRMRNSLRISDRRRA